MFFMIPGGGIFSFIILFLVIRLVARSLFGGSSQNNYKKYYNYNQQQQRQQSNQQQQRTYTYTPAKNYYSVLGLTETATEEEIKKAYRKLIMEYHPDQVANKGLNEDMKNYATKRFREIQEAYEEICKIRGIK